MSTFYSNQDVWIFCTIILQLSDFSSTIAKRKPWPVCGCMIIMVIATASELSQANKEFHLMHQCFHIISAQCSQGVSLQIPLSFAPEKILNITIEGINRCCTVVKRLHDRLPSKRSKVQTPVRAEIQIEISLPRTPLLHLWDHKSVNTRVSPKPGTHLQ